MDSWYNSYYYMHLSSQVTVTGSVRGTPLHAVIKADTAKAFFLGVGNDSMCAVIGCDDGRAGLRFGVLAPALLHLAATRQTAEGIALDEFKLSCMNGSGHPDTIQARYEPGLLSRFGLRR